MAPPRTPTPTLARAPLGVQEGQPLGRADCGPSYLDPAAGVYVAQMRAETARWRTLELAIRASLAGKTSAQGREALKAVSDANSNCLLIVDVTEGAAPGLVIYDTRLYGPGVVAIFDGVAWRAHAFVLPDGSGGKEAFLWRNVRVVRDGADLLVLATVFAAPVCRSGCGGAGPAMNTGWIGLYRLGDPPSLLWRSTGGIGYGSLLLSNLSNDFVLETFLADPDPDPVHASGLVQGSGVQWGALAQTLWERRGLALVARAQRVSPSPSRAADVFLGALQQNDDATALRFAANSALVESWKGAPQDLEPVEPAADAARVEAEEAANWDALPADARGPAPTSTRLVYRAGKYVLVLTRVDGVWKVSALEPTPP